MRRWSAVVILIAACATGPAVKYPPLTGTWILNHEESDTLRSAIGRMSKTTKLDVSDESIDRAERLYEPPELLDIRRAGKRLEIEGGNGTIRMVDLDPVRAAKQNRATPSRWEGDTLVLTLQAKPEITESYQLLDGSRRLAVSLSIESSRFPGPLIVRWIYDRE